MPATVDDSVDTTEAAERARTDVLLDSLRNLIISRITVYFFIIEAVLFVVGYGTHALAGPYTEAADAQYVMAGIFGVFGILIGGLFTLYLLIGTAFATVRAFKSDF